MITQIQLFFVTCDQGDAIPSPVLAPVLTVLNQLESEGLIKDYAIGGSLALMHYCEPFYTKDLDIYCFIPNTTVLIDLGPIYKRLTELGFKPEGQGILIEGVLVEFLPPHGKLSEEALTSALRVTVEGVLTRIFDYEHAIAMKVNANRATDWAHIASALASADPDLDKLRKILLNHELMERWKRHELPI